MKLISINIKPYQYLTLIGLFSYNAYSQSLNLNVSGAGSRATAMGGAFIGVADDVTAVYWNPAGTATIDYTYEMLEDGQGMHALVSGRNQSLQVTSETTPVTYTPRFSPSFVGVMIPYKKATLTGKPVSLGRFDPSIVFSAAYHNVMDGNNYQTQQTLPSSSTSIKSNLNISTASLSAAYQFSPYMSVGLTANYWFGLGGKLSYTATQQSDNLTRTGTGQYRISGVNFIGGLMFDFYDNNLPLRLGFRVSTPFALRNKYTLDGTVQRGSLDLQESSLYNQKYKMPFTAGVGVAYRPFWRLLLTGDVEILPYKGQSVSQTFFEYNQYNSLFSSSSLPLVVDNPVRPVLATENLYQLRGGGEVFLLDSRLFEMRILGGYRQQSYLNNDGSSSIARGFSAGVSVFFDRFKIHGAYEQLKYQQGVTSINHLTRTNLTLDLVVLLQN
ncbi:hypothetical protein P1X15_22205 [Runella sp. MFBS21]|uniref:hypothetical protein n=1 Tax=Runella sp. MFBS21 TaxID=3034018 RepID=UPI0023F9A941|nr:hypothetical protein [Runella sp. MFBS21]MDF7820351.1 hypothetical protein [Runella sp. MFBS21]